MGVQDVVSAMTWLMVQGTSGGSGDPGTTAVNGQRYILNSGDYSYREVLEMIAAALGKPRTQKLVSPSTLRMLARLDAVTGFFTRKRRITSEHARAAFSESKFSSAKVKEAIGMEFTPVKDVVEQVARYYRKDYPL